jgi:mono/diheme cytochrome c family protein
MRVPAGLPTLAIFVIILASACDQPPDASTVWTPGDHDKQEQSQNQQAAQPASSGPQQGAQFVEVAWMRACAECHGPRGMGDGPNGPMVKAPDLTDPEWQAKVKDDEIEERIRKGKGQMPAFDIPEPALKAFVARIRALRRPR